MRRSCRLRVAALIATLALVTVCCGGSADPPTVAEALDALVAAGVPGGIVIVSGPSGTQTTVAGLAGPGVAIREDHAFPIGGLTTSYVATVMLQLESDGLVTLGESLEDHLPGRFDYAWDIAVYDLLQHTSGVPDYMSVGDGQGLVIESCLASGRCAWTADELIGLVDQGPPSFGPGEGWGYSNTNYVLIGEILESVTGGRWDEVITTRLLYPLGLSETVFDPADADVPMGHVDLDEDGQLDSVTPVPGGTGPEGGIVATAGDVMGFFRPLLRGDTLDPAAQTALTATAPTSFGHEDYGLGVSFVFGFAQPQIGNTGEALGYSSFVEHNRDTDVTTVILLNQSGGLPADEWSALLRVATDVPGRSVQTRAAESGPGQLRFYCTLDPELFEA